MQSGIFTSGSVTAGHPDKLCDQISDAIVDQVLATDPLARLTAESAVAKGIVFVALRSSNGVEVDIANTARAVIDKVGYRRGAFQARTCSVMTSIGEAPREAAWLDDADLAPDQLDRHVAEQQVTLFGYACRQSTGLMPYPIWLANRLVEKLDQAREAGLIDGISPDGNSQVSVEFEDGRPSRLFGITLLTTPQEPDAAGAPDIEEALREHVVASAFDGEALKPDAKTRIVVNPPGLAEPGGPERHAGLTGRKTGVDTYGDFARHSEAALSGKDPVRIDRSGAYMARFAARAVVEAGFAEACEVQVSYALGSARPVSLTVETFDTGKMSDSKIAKRLQECFDFRPAAILARFSLRHLPRQNGGRYYENLAAYGHMGRSDPAPPWEDTAEAAAGLAG